jgi:hypothetical protein
MYSVTLRAKKKSFWGAHESLSFAPSIGLEFFLLNKKDLIMVTLQQTGLYLLSAVSLSLFHTHAHTLSLSLSFTHTHTLFLSLSLTLSLSNSLFPIVVSIVYKDFTASPCAGAIYRNNYACQQFVMAPCSWILMSTFWSVPTSHTQSSPLAFSWPFAIIPFRGIRLNTIVSSTPVIRNRETTQHQVHV